MPKRYAREFRRDICKRLVAGERVKPKSWRHGQRSGDASRSSVKSLRATHHELRRNTPSRLADHERGRRDVHDRSSEGLVKSAAAPQALGGSGPISWHSRSF